MNNDYDDEYDEYYKNIPEDQSGIYDIIFLLHKKINKLDERLRRIENKDLNKELDEIDFKHHTSTINGIPIDWERCTYEQRQAIGKSMDNATIMRYPTFNGYVIMGNIFSKTSEK